MQTPERRPRTRNKSVLLESSRVEWLEQVERTANATQDNVFRHSPLPLAYVADKRRMNRINGQGSNYRRLFTIIVLYERETK